jgi:hypothetical protein
VAGKGEESDRTPGSTRRTVGAPSVGVRRSFSTGPATNFADPDLQRGQAVVNALGIPMPCSGNFADVYQVECPGGSRWAVKCFTREAVGLRERYQEMRAWLRRANLSFTVDFVYLELGVRVVGQWYLVLKCIG